MKLNSKFFKLTASQSFLSMQPEQIIPAKARRKGKAIEQQNA
jgi:hypothetical protein